MPEPSIQNLARATGRDADELAHLLVCGVCTPVAQCDENPALIRAALAAYRGGPRPQHRDDEPEVSTRRRGEGDADEYRRIRESAGVRAPLAGLADSDPRRK